MSSSAERLSIQIDDQRQVSGLLLNPPRAKACYVLAHGAGAGMTHPFMCSMSAALAERGVATLRYQFHYMEKGSKRPDSPKLAEATVRAAVEEANRLLGSMPLMAGGKSFGGRMTSQAQSSEPLPGVRGLAFLGFPLHPPGSPGTTRAEHLSAVEIPLLFLQGSRDQFADLELLKPVVGGLGKRARLHLIEDADHSFHVPRKTGRSDREVLLELADTIAAWIDEEC